MTFSTLGTMASYVPKQGVTGTVDLSTATVVKGAGMDLITPTSVVNATLSGGQVTFSAAATVSINGCFTSAYDTYDLVWYSTNATDQEIRFRMRLAGTDNSASSYEYQWTTGASTTVSTVRSTAQAQGLITRNLGTVSLATMRLTAPALAANTATRSYGISTPGINVFDISSHHAVATAYDGITLIPGVGTLTGTVRIYGLRNS